MGNLEGTPASGSTNEGLNHSFCRRAECQGRIHSQSTGQLDEIPGDPCDPAANLCSHPPSRHLWRYPSDWRNDIRWHILPFRFRHSSMLTFSLLPNQSPWPASFVGMGKKMGTARWKPRANKNPQLAYGYARLAFASRDPPCIPCAIACLPCS